MIGPVSTSGRAMMASLQQAIQKGMPPDQAIQYVKSMATQGVAPLADLYAMMNQFQRLKQQPVQAPQTPPTIKDQLNMLDQQQQMQAQQGNIQQMQAPAPAGVPMDRGLGAIDAGNMEYPAFAGGGIVAFSNGREVVGQPTDIENEVKRILAKSPYFRTAEENEVLRTAGMQLSKRTVGAPVKFPGADLAKRIVDPSNLTNFTGTIDVRALEPDVAPVPEQPTAPAKPAAPAGTPVDMMGDIAKRRSDDLLSVASPFARPEDRMKTAFDLMSTRKESEPAPPQRDQVRTGTGRAATTTTTAPREDGLSQFEREVPDLEKIRSERIERERANKTGQFSQADQEMAAFIKEQKEQFGASEKEARNNFWINAGASLMANRSPSFLTALGQSVKENYGNLVGDLKALKKEQQAYRLQEIQLRRAQEQAMQSGDEKDIARYETMYERAQNTNFQVYKLRSEIQQKVLDRASSERIAQMRAAGSGDLATQYMSQWEAIQKMPEGADKDKAMAAWQQKLDASRTVQGAVTASGASAQSDRQRAVASAVSDVQKTGEYEKARRAYYSDSTSEADKAKAYAKMQKMEQDAMASVGRVFNIPLNTGYVPTIGGGAGGAGSGPTTSGWFD